VRQVVFAVASVLLLGGCGTGTPARTLPGTLPGAQVGAMAERQLESAHPRMAVGTIVCPDLRFRVGREVVCVRTAELSGGRQVEVRVRVRVTSLREGGRLHVRTEDRVSAYRITGEHLAADLRARVLERYRIRPDAVRCPVLPGRVGARVRCSVMFGNGRLIAPVTTRSCDDSSYEIRYAFDRVLFPRRLNPGLPTLLKIARRGGLGS
jgi:hypothetical protein